MMEPLCNKPPLRSPARQLRSHTHGCSHAKGYGHGSEYGHGHRYGQANVYNHSSLHTSANARDHLPGNGHVHLHIPSVAFHGLPKGARRHTLPLILVCTERVFALLLLRESSVAPITLWQQRVWLSAWFAAAIRLTSAHSRAEGGRGGVMHVLQQLTMGSIPSGAGDRAKLLKLAYTAAASVEILVLRSEWLSRVAVCAISIARLRSPCSSLSALAVCLLLAATSALSFLDYSHGDPKLSSWFFNLGLGCMLAALEARGSAWFELCLACVAGAAFCWDQAPVEGVALSMLFAALALLIQGGGETELDRHKASGYRLLTRRQMAEKVLEDSEIDSDDEPI